MGDQSASVLSPRPGGRRPPPVPSAEKSTAPASSAGFILLDSTDRPVWFNAEGIGILAYPQNPEEIKSPSRFLAEEIRKRLLRQDGSGERRFVTEVMAGKRRYWCRVYPLLPAPNNPSRPIVALLIERMAPRSINVSRIAEEFRLTRREREAMELLILGLTSKEIASRMRISANTVKAFLRLVMTKMGVSTRSGIIGKIVRA